MDGPDVPPIPKLRATPEDARHTPNDPGHPSALMLAHGTMEVRWYAPREHDPQSPHDRDEVYMIVSGSGTFVRANDADPFDQTALPLRGEERVPFSPGDVLFVPAGADHRFEQFTPDFAAWTVFYGPEGGERP